METVVAVRRYPLIGGPVCGLYLQYTKDELWIKFRYYEDRPLVAKYRFAVNGYYHEKTVGAVEAGTAGNKVEIKLAEAVATETPPTWEDRDEYPDPWPKWSQWQLKERK